MISVIPVGGADVFIPPDPCTLLLIHADGANDSTTFTDASKYTRTLTSSGGAKVSTAQSKFGGASALFDGSGDFVNIPSSSNLNLGAGDFTIEAWIRPASLSARMILGSNTTGKPFLGFNSPTTIGFGRASVAWDIEVAHGIASADTWHHVAVCRRATSMKIFVDGSQVGATATNSQSYDFSGGFTLGGGGGGTDYSGYVDELRLSAAARWIDNFTVPDYPYVG